MQRTAKVRQRKILLDKSNRYCYNIFMFNKRLNVAKELERIKEKKANRKPVPWRMLIAHPLSWILFSLLVMGVFSQ